MRFERVPYGALNARQKENYNFHKVASRLADYGFTSLRLTDDFEGADFVALHVDGETILRVQLKGRLTFDRKYVGKDIWIGFRHNETVYLYPHDELLAHVLAAGKMERTLSWTEKGLYSFPVLSTWAREMLKEHMLG